MGSIDEVRRVLEVAVLDVLGLENSIARTQVLIAAWLAAARLLEVTLFESFSLEAAEET